MEKTLDTIRRIRLQRGYSQDEMADLMGVERSTYSNFETGKTKLFSKSMSRFAEVLGITEEEIILGGPRPLTAGYLQEGTLEDRMEAIESKLDTLNELLRQLNDALNSIPDTNRSQTSK